MVWKDVAGFVFMVGATLFALWYADPFTEKEDPPDVKLKALKRPASDAFLAAGKGWPSYVPGDEEFFQRIQWIRTDAHIQPGTKPPYLYHSAAVKKLARVEGILYEGLKYLEKRMLDGHLEELTEYVRDYEQSSVNLMRTKAEDEEAAQLERDYVVVSNPIVAHRLLRRFAVDYQKIVDTVKALGREWENALIYLTDLAQTTKSVYNMKFPTEEDELQSMKSLIRIMDYSNITARDLCTGVIGDIRFGVGLRSKHAFAMSKAVGPSKPAERIEWLDVALVLKQKESNAIAALRETKRMGDELMNAMLEHDKVCFPANSADTSALSCFTIKMEDERKTDPKDLKPRVKTEFLRRVESGYPNNRQQLDYSLHTRRTFKAVCSGIDWRTESEKSKLFCWYDSKRTPYLILAPVKFEQIARDPDLWQVHDVITQNQIQQIITFSVPHLERSLVVNATDPNHSNMLSEARTSSQMWIYENTPDKSLMATLTSVGRRIEYATGLNVLWRRSKAAAEAWQVASYRASHHYDEHLDGYVQEGRTVKLGNRIATFMLYLTDVESGGYTGFPYMGTASKPVAGSAAFWFNLYRNGSGLDLRTYHGGCPISLGVKWVMNKWIMEHENFDRWPCTRN